MKYVTNKNKKYFIILTITILLFIIQCTQAGKDLKEIIIMVISILLLGITNIIIKKIKEKNYVDKLRKTIKPKEVIFYDKLLINYGRKKKEEKFEYIVVFKDDKNKIYMAKIKKLFGDYKYEGKNINLELFLNNKKIEIGTKCNIYIDDDYGYTIYDEISRKFIIDKHVLREEEKNANSFFLSPNYIKNLYSNNDIKMYDDAIYFKGIIDFYIK